MFLFVYFAVSCLQMYFASDEDDNEETEEADTWRVRRSDGLAMLHDDNDLDADETTLPLK